MIRNKPRPLRAEADIQMLKNDVYRATLIESLGCKINPPSNNSILLETRYLNFFFFFKSMFVDQCRQTFYRLFEHLVL